jgi:hypothetical protein
VRNFLGMDVNTSALVSSSGLNGLSMDAASFSLGLARGASCSLSQRERGHESGQEGSLFLH